MTWHTSLAAGRWHTLTLAEQLGNIGSEVGRTLAVNRKDDKKRSQSAFERALELFDLSAADRRWEYHRLREILRAREEFCRIVSSGKPIDKNFERYFTQFGLLARRMVR